MPNPAIDAECARHRAANSEASARRQDDTAVDAALARDAAGQTEAPAAQRPQPPVMMAEPISPDALAVEQRLVSRRVRNGVYRGVADPEMRALGYNVEVPIRNAQTGKVHTWRWNRAGSWCRFSPTVGGICMPGSAAGPSGAPARVDDTADGPRRRLSNDEQLMQGDDLTVRTEADMDRPRGLEEVDCAGETWRDPSEIRPPTLAELDAVPVASPRDPSGALTPAGRTDLARRLDAARRHLGQDTGPDGGTAGLETAIQILDRTAALYGIDRNRLGRHLTTEGGDPDVVAMLTRPATDPMPQSDRAPDPVTDTAFLQRAFDDVPLPDGPDRAPAPERHFAGVARGDADAQRALNGMLAAPSHYRVENVSWSNLEAGLRGNRPGGDAGALNADVGTLRIGEGQVIVQGRRNRDGQRATDEQGNRLFTFRDGFPDYDQAGETVLQLGDGRLRVWRMPDNTLVLETVAADGRARQHHERSQETHSQAGLDGPATELAHALGAGLGAEAPFGIRRALVHVNQELQGRGIEAYIGALGDAAPEGVDFAYRTEIRDQPADNRLANVTYGVDMIVNGQRVPFVEFAIDTSALPPDTPPGSVAARDLIGIDPVEPRGMASMPPALRYFVDAVHDTVPLPESITRRVGQGAGANGLWPFGCRSGVPAPRARGFARLGHWFWFGAHRRVWFLAAPRGGSKRHFNRILGNAP